MIHNKLKYTHTFYRGDVLFGVVYFFVGIIGLVVGFTMYQLFTRLGFYYLMIGMGIFFLYTAGKGIFLIYIYYSRYRYYRDKSFLSESDIGEELAYSRYRKQKKKSSRRVFIYTIFFGILIGLFGFFSNERGLIESVCIPVILMGGVELWMGAMKEFRINEYIKILKT